MSTVLMAITLMQKVLPIPEQAVTVGLKNVRLAGRIQIIEGQSPRYMMFHIIQIQWRY